MTTPKNITKQDYINTFSEFQMLLNSFIITRSDTTYITVQPVLIPRRHIGYQRFWQYTQRTCHLLVSIWEADMGQKAPPSGLTLTLPQA